MREKTMATEVIKQSVVKAADKAPKHDGKILVIHVLPGGVMPIEVNMYQLTPVKSGQTIYSENVPIGKHRSIKFRNHQARVTKEELQALRYTKDGPRKGYGTEYMEAVNQNDGDECAINLADILDDVYDDRGETFLALLTKNSYQANIRPKATGALVKQWIFGEEVGLGLKQPRVKKELVHA